MRQAITRFIAACTSHPLSLLGTALTSLSAFVFLLLVAIHALSERGGGPYLGILTFLILPIPFVLGLVLIPYGIHRERKRRGSNERRLPTFDLNDPGQQKTALVVVVLTVVNALILGAGTYKGVEVMESTEFCGKACHTVMEPEHTTYLRSPHARVRCVECHIGEGADWFVKSKLSGSWQLVSVTFGLYDRPIAVPVHSLRPARETCEQCHWPQKFVGDRLKVLTHHAEDEANTPMKTVLLLHVGGVQSDRSHGIHWHVDPGVAVRYRSDRTRQKIAEVELNEKGRPTRRFVNEAVATSGVATEWRTMDCVDCHNRPSHVYRLPEAEIDSSLAEKRIDATLPFVRREGLRILREDYASHEAARLGISKALAQYYATAHADLSAIQHDAIEAAGRELGNIWCSNVFPKMKVTWGAYPVNIGHANMEAVGCFRCHGGDLVSWEGESVTSDCSACHSVLAQDEADPAILKTLRP
jgi:hypothetical protein